MMLAFECVSIIIYTVVTFAFLDTGEGYGCQCFYREIGAM